jgi:DNA-binding response OmpR family regulator
MHERVLIIDDDPAVHEVVRGSLERDGYTVDSALEGSHGLRLSASRAPAVIVLELALSGIPGEDVLREVRRRSAVPILVLSTRVRVEERVRGLDLGADDYMTKPFSPVEVLARIEALLRRDLLVLLAEHPGRVRSRGEIAYLLRSNRRAGGERLIDVHIRNLRRKIEDDPARPRRVETIRGRGYRIALEQ